MERVNEARRNECAPRGPAGLCSHSAVSKHILVVDDEADIREVLHYALKKEGFTVTAVAEGQAEISAAVVPVLVGETMHLSPSWYTAPTAPKAIAWYWLFALGPRSASQRP